VSKQGIPLQYELEGTRWYREAQHVPCPSESVCFHGAALGWLRGFGLIFEMLGESQAIPPARFLLFLR
jgi:hypothetical protein